MGINNTNNLPSVSLGDFIQIVEQQLDEGNFRPIFGLGKGGIGKTESIEYIARKRGIGYIDIRLLLYSEVDLKGIPYPDADHIKTIWLQNNILPTEKDGEHGILVFDEITSCGRSVRTAAYQLLNERKLGEYKLPDGWLVVCLGNGENDGGDYNGIEGNFGNRCSIYNVTANLETWKEYALSRGVNEMVIAYVSWRPSHLHTYDPDKETDILFASPRSWVGISDILNKNNFNAQADSSDRASWLIKSRILGNIGTEVGNQFIAFCKYRNETVDPHDIIVRGERPAIKSEEVVYITIQSCVKLITEMFAKDANGQKVTQDTKLSAATINGVANFISWMLDKLKMESAVMGIKDLTRANRDAFKEVLLNPSYGFTQKCPEYLTFIREHSKIFYDN